jgi:ketosteroid isomerase-like protein
MSQDNVEIVRELFQLFNPAEIDQFAEHWHPDSVVTAPEGWPEPGPFVGRDAVMRQFKRIFADVSEYRFEKLRILAVRDDWVVIAWHWHTRGATSGIDAEFDFAQANRFVDGKIIEAHFRWRPEDAFQAAGLSE